MKKETLLALELSPDYRHEKSRCVRLFYQKSIGGNATGGTEGEADAFGGRERA